MKSIQLIKQLNNTELGRGATHETYILIPQDLDVSDLFEEVNKEYDFKDKTTGKLYTIRLTSSREKRIVGMGPYYKANDVMAGDKILLEKRIYDSGEINYRIGLNRSQNTVYFQKVKGFFEMMNSESDMTLLNKKLVNSNGQTIKVEYHGEIQKRKDSPVLTKVYNIIVDQENIQSNYSERDMIGICMSSDSVKFIGAQLWKKYVIEVK